MSSPDMTPRRRIRMMQRLRDVHIAAGLLVGLAGALGLTDHPYLAAGVIGLVLLLQIYSLDAQLTLIAAEKGVLP